MVQKCHAFLLIYGICTMHPCIKQVFYTINRNLLYKIKQLFTAILHEKTTFVQISKNSIPTLVLFNVMR